MDPDQDNFTDSKDVQIPNGHADAIRKNHAKSANVGAHPDHTPEKLAHKMSHDHLQGQVGQKVQGPLTVGAHPDHSPEALSNRVAMGQYPSQWDPQSYNF